MIDKVIFPQYLKYLNYLNKKTIRVTLYNFNEIKGKIVRRIYTQDGREIVSVIPKKKTLNK